jgi:hypothetical protein
VNGEKARIWLDPLVARERERLGQLLEADVLARRQPYRFRSRAGWRHRLGERGGRGDDQSTRREDVEGPRALSDEVWRRFEP